MMQFKAQWCRECPEAELHLNTEVTKFLLECAVDRKRVCDSGHSSCIYQN